MVTFQIPLPGLARTFESLTAAEKHFIEYFVIALTQDIIFDYTKTEKLSPVPNLNY